MLLIGDFAHCDVFDLLFLAEQLGRARVGTFSWGWAGVAGLGWAGWALLGNLGITTQEN